MNESKSFQEFYLKSCELASFAIQKCKTKKETITYFRKTYDKSELKNYYKIGILKKEHIKLLETNTEIIRISIDSMIKNIIEHPDLSFNDYLNLEDIIKFPYIVIKDRKRNLRFFKSFNNKFYEVVIKTTKLKQENYLITYHRCDEAKIKETENLKD